VSGQNVADGLFGTFRVEAKIIL